MHATKERLAERHESLWMLTVSPTIWALHFMVCYVTAAIWCAKVPTALAPLGGVRIVILILTIAALAGIAIGLVEILTFFVYGRGLPVAVGNPLIIGGSLLVTTGVGVLLLREALSPLQLLGVGLIGLGIALFAWDAAR